MTKITRRRAPVAGVAFTFRGIEPNEHSDDSDDVVSEELIVSPLNFDSLLELEDKLKGYDEAELRAKMATLTDVLDHSLRRNYIAVPRWLITQTIDLGNMGSLMQSAMDISGLYRQRVEDEKKATLSAGSTSSPTS